MILSPDDQTALSNLAYRYALAVDQRDVAMLQAQFTPDGGIEGFGENPISFLGPDRLAAMIGQVDASFGPTMHKVFNQTFDGNADRSVTGVTYCTASHIIPGDHWSVLDMTLLYHNQYARIDDGSWRFARRALQVQWVETRPVQQFSADMMRSDLKRFR